MNFKKKVSGSWVDAPYYLKGTDTETITTLPATIYPLAQTATLGLKGNTVQNGTPTPQNPVDVVGVGTLDGSDYKIPISSNSQTETVYLGNTQSVRIIKKKVLDGTENWTQQGSSSYRYFRIDDDISAIVGYAISNCYEQAQISVSNTNVGINVQNVSAYTYPALVLRPENFAGMSLSDFKSYLSSNPVTVWYVLGSEETGIVNEPLMKIGDYADSISGISIPTTDGANTLDVDTTIKPSEVTASFNGWHPVTSAHERDNGAWD